MEFISRLVICYNMFWKAWSEMQFISRRGYHYSPYIASFNIDPFHYRGVSMFREQEFMALSVFALLDRGTSAVYITVRF